MEDREALSKFVFVKWTLDLFIIIVLLYYCIWTSPAMQTVGHVGSLSAVKVFGDHLLLLHFLTTPWPKKTPMSMVVLRSE